MRDWGWHRGRKRGAKSCQKKRLEKPKWLGLVWRKDDDMSLTGRWWCFAHGDMCDYSRCTVRISQSEPYDNFQRLETWALLSSPSDLFPISIHHLPFAILPPRHLRNPSYLDLHPLSEDEWIHKLKVKS